MNLRSSLLVAVSCLGLVAQARAADLRSSFDFENSLVLPSGVRNPRFKNLIMSMDERITGEGLVQPLGNRLNKVVTWGDVLDAQDDDAQRATLEGFLAAKGIRRDGSAGSTTGVVNTYANVKVPVFALGVTDWYTLAVAVPVTHVEVNADTSFARSEDGQSFVNHLAETDPVKGWEAARKLNNAVNRKLERYGYEPIKSTTVDHVGDIVVANKFRVYKGRRDELAVKGTVTLPTGIAPNADKALDVPTGDGQWDVGGTLIWDHLFGEHLRTDLYAGYTAQLPDRIDRRLPQSHTESLSRDKENVDRDLGDVYTTGASLAYQFDFGLQAACGYAYQHMEEARYSGKAYDPSRYHLVGFDSNQTMHTVLGGLGFNGVDLYKRKKLPVPFQVNAVYSHPFEGENVVLNDVIAIEASLFF